jgi:hypothetical protein
MLGAGDRGVDDKENDDRTEVPDDEYRDDDEAIDVSVHEERANEVQGYMKELLKDLGMFKKKIGDDKSRFVTPLGERVNK